MNMQYLRRLLSVACVCLCVLFSNSLIAYADDNISTFNLDEDSQLKVVYHWLVNNNPHSMFNGLFTNDMTYTEKNYTQSLTGWTWTTNLADRLHFSLSDGSRMFSKGSSIDFNFRGISNYNAIGNALHAMKNTSNYKVKVQFINSKGTVHEVTPSDFDFYSYSMNYTYSLTFTIDDIPCDVYSMYVYLTYNPGDYNGISSYFGTSINMVHHGGFYGASLEMVETKADKTDGLLATIIQAVNNIKDNIVQLPQKIADSIKGFFDNVVNTLENVKLAIVTALETLGNMILDGIKELFLPSQDDIVEMQSKWETLLADRFGAIYQAVALIFDYVETFQEREQGTIEFPVVTIPLGDVDFEFGGYTVKVVPDGFELLIDALKMVVSISCTVLFVNTLKRKYDKLVEG